MRRIQRSDMTGMARLRRRSAGDAAGRGRRNIRRAGKTNPGMHADSRPAAARPAPGHRPGLAAAVHLRHPRRRHLHRRLDDPRGLGVLRQFRAVRVPVRIHARQRVRPQGRARRLAGRRGGFAVAHAAAVSHAPAGVLLFGAMVAVAGATILPGEAERLGWGFLAADPLRAVPGLLAMLYQPEFMGILPVFVWCMLLLPGFAVALNGAGAGRRWRCRWPATPRSGRSAWRCRACSRAGASSSTRSPGSCCSSPAPGWGGGRCCTAQALPFGARLAARVALWAAFTVLAAGLVMRLTWYGFVPWPAPFGEESLDRGQGEPGLAAAAARAGAGLRGGGAGAARRALDAPRPAAGAGANRPGTAWRYSASDCFCHGGLLPCSAWCRRRELGSPRWTRP